MIDKILKVNSNMKASEKSRCKSETPQNELK